LLQCREGVHIALAPALRFRANPAKIGFFRSETDLVYHDEVDGHLFQQVRQTLDLLHTKYLKAVISYEGIKSAAQLGMTEHLSINFLPNAIYKPEVCIRTTLEAARTHGFPTSRIIYEVTEGERVEDGAWLAEILREYQRCGFLTAIDGFGAGCAGLKLLADFQPDLIKIDMDLVRHIDTSKSRQAIVRSLVRLCDDMVIRVIAEGIETAGERDFLEDAGVRLMQGYLFARPAFQAVATIDPQTWQGVSR